MYANYKKNHFPKLLKDPLISEEDKRKICDLLRKPWNPYLRRHTTVTETSKTVKDPIILNRYFGWTENSNMHRRYTHYFADDSVDAILTMMDGLKPPSSSTNTNSEKKGLLRPKQCPNCSEVNKPENRFCSKCKFVLSYDAFNEVTKAAEERTKEFEKLQEKQQSALERMSFWASRMEIMTKQLEEQSAEIARLKQNRR